jgi:polysaccharide pyruvyl transferase WcaK-like protein
MRDKSTTSPLTVSFIGATLWGNRGAEAMLVTAIGKVREICPGVRCVIHSYMPGNDTRLCHDPSIEIVPATPAALVFLHFPFALIDRLLRYIKLKWPRTLMPHCVRLLAESDILIDIFGISYADGREKFLPFNVLSNLPAMLLNVPVIKLSQGMGPFKGFLTRIAAKYMLSGCNHVFARGLTTEKLVHELGIQDSVDVSADIAFLYNPDYSLTVENDDYIAGICRSVSSLKEQTDSVVMFSVSSVVYNKCRKRGIDYPGIISTCIQRLCEQGCGVVVLPNATRESLTTLRNNDIIVVNMIAGLLHDSVTDNVICINHDINTSGIRGVMQLCDMVVASRFHAMVAAIALNKPVLVFGWGHKYEEVLTMAGIPGQAFDYKDLAGDTIIESIESLLKDQQNLKNTMAQMLSQVKASAEKQFNWLKSYITTM